MKCPICNSKVLNNSDYSVHMNKTHRGTPYNLLDYKDLNKVEGKNKHGSSNSRSKTNVDSKVD
jgi:uncharacterized C2H2 Zn-finger protein